MWFNDPIRKNRKELARLYARKHEIEDQGEVQALPGSALESMIQQIDALIEGDYSRAVYEKYSVKQPALVRKLTGETVQWKDAFGDSFDKTTKGQRHSLVELIEGDGMYRFK